MNVANATSSSHHHQPHDGLVSGAAEAKPVQEGTVFPVAAAAKSSGNEGELLMGEGIITNTTKDNSTLPTKEPSKNEGKESLTSPSIKKTVSPMAESAEEPHTTMAEISDDIRRALMSKRPSPPISSPFPTPTVQELPTRSSTTSQNTHNYVGAYMVAPGTLQRTNSFHKSHMGAPDAAALVMQESLQQMTTTSPPSGDGGRKHTFGSLRNSKLTVANLVEDGLANPDLPRALDYSSHENEARERHQKENKEFKTKLLLGVIAFLVVVMILVAVLVSRPDSANELVPAPSSTTSPTSNPTQAPTTLPNYVLSLLPTDTTTTILEHPESSQSRAYDWLLEDGDNMMLLPEARIKQKFALAALFFATGGHDWDDNTNWLNHSVHECDYYNKPDFARKKIVGNVYPGYLSEFFPPSEPLPTPCNQEGLYEHLWLDQNNLVGSLPEELFLLTSLLTFSVGNNRLTGTISTQISQLSKLTGLSILDQPSEGNIPSEIGLLTDLRGLLLSNGDHQGPMPSELWQLTNLETFLFLDYPDMGGSVQTEIGLFPRLKWLVFDSCSVTGTLPSEVGLIESLEWIVFRANKVSGMLPTEIGRLSNLLLNSWRNNELTGSLPSELGLLTALTTTNLQLNHLTGTIPTELGRWTNLVRSFNLENNQLTGTIPSELGLLTLAHEIWMSHNQISGQILSELGMAELGSLKVTHNNLSGSIPEEFADLQQSLHTLSLEGNPMLTGTVPDTLCSLNGTCGIFFLRLEPCEELGVSFDCTDMICGCECSCEGVGQR